MDFHPTPTDRAAVELAKRVCRECPVSADCLAHALQAEERLGVWGGLSEGERDRLRRGSSVNGAGNGEDHED